MMHVAHLTVHSFIGMGSHMALYPPIPSPAIAPHVSMDTLLGLNINAKWSKTVIGPFGFQFIGQGNDSGFLVPHIAIPPPSVLVPLVIIFGSSKPMFSASTVQIDVDGGGLPMAAGMIPYNFVSINQACNDPCNYPSDMVISPNTVVVGLTLGDYIGGFLNIAIDCIISALVNKVAGDLAEVLVARVGPRIAALYLRNFTRTLTEMISRESAERMTRESITNIMGRPLVTATQELIGKLTENLIGNPLDRGAGLAGMSDDTTLATEIGHAYDRPSDDSEPTATDSTSGAMTEPYPGAAPIHSAD